MKFGNIRIGALVSGAVALVAALVIIPNLWENLDASDVMVIQSPMSGELTVYTDPGLKWQGFGKVTKYPRQRQYSFDYNPDTKVDNSKKIRFSDGGHAQLYGAVSWEMPLDAKEIIAIQKKFGSADAVEQRGVVKMIDSAVYLTGPMMSSTESSGERRSELVQYINDQAENGVYVTSVREKEVDDPLLNTKKVVTSTDIVRDANGNPKRQQGSILNDFGIKLLPLAVSDLKYDAVVENQIKQRQDATTQVQIAQANAKRAEQDAITAAKQGEANAAKAKWVQETIKATEVTKAEQQLAVATLGAQEAAQYKNAQILRGEGDAQRRQLVMAADGALDQKLIAYKEVNAKYAEAIAQAQPGAWTPAVVMGSGSAGSGTNATSLIDLLTAKTARDLGIDLTTAGKAATAKTSKK